MYAGGLSYLSSGSFRGASRVGASVWPEALASASSKVRQMKKPIPEMPKDLRPNKARLFLVCLIIGHSWLEVPLMRYRLAWIVFRAEFLGLSHAFSQM